MNPSKICKVLIISIAIIGIGIELTAQTTPKREMRGIWISTVSNIDWPSKPGLAANQLKSEADAIMDQLLKLGFNAIFLQVRPASDAFYASSIEPWSVYLTGNQGTVPEKGFDPLQYWVEQSHQRGIELHAWINPFRAATNAQQGTSPQHITNTHPEWLIQYNKKQYIDPGLPQARAYISKIAEEITRNYDIDGLHIDDYFYPYPAANEPFADTLSFRSFNSRKLSLEDWRRDNINQFIQETHRVIKATKPWVAFGVSPFGVWRNANRDQRGSQTTAGTTAYDILYADVLTWMKNKWVDYVVPQIYWESTHSSANFNTLVDWWAQQNGCIKYIGHAIYKINNGTTAWADKEEMPNQMKKARQSKNIQGSVLFSYKQLNRDLLGLDSFLMADQYRNKALTPMLLSKTYQPIKITHLKQKRHTLQWKTDNDKQVRFFIVYRHHKKEKFAATNSQYIYCITSRNQLKVEHQRGEKYHYRIAPIDLYRKEHELSKAIKIKN